MRRDIRCRRRVAQARSGLIFASSHLFFKKSGLWPVKTTRTEHPTAFEITSAEPPAFFRACFTAPGATVGSHVRISRELNKIIARTGAGLYRPIVAVQI